MSSIYPTTDNRKALYYVEFNRGDKEGEFTIFRRQWMHSEAELAEMEKKSPADSQLLRLCNEVHPWNIFTAEYGPDGCVPDKTWVQWMVDALNNQFDADLKALTAELKK